MKTGTVLLFAGTCNLDSRFDDDHAARQLGLNPHLALFAARKTGYYSLRDALRLLVQKGCKKVEAVHVIQTLDGQVKPIGEAVHLYG